MGLITCESWSGSGTTRDGYRERDSVVVQVQRTEVLDIEKGNLYTRALNTK